MAGIPRMLLFLSCSYLVCGQGCIRASKRNSDPVDTPFSDGNNDPLPSHNAVQAVITSYKFSCDCVNITSWETYVEPGDTRHINERAYDIIFQVWRPSPTTNDTGCYSLVGQNIFPSLSFDEGGLVQLTPTPPLNSIITAQSGDVVGYYTNSRRGANHGIQLNRETDYDQNRIWYHDFGSNSDPLVFLNNECPVSVGNDGSLRSLTHAAPILKVSTNTFSCEQMTTHSTNGISSTFLQLSSHPHTSDQASATPFMTLLEVTPSTSISFMESTEIIGQISDMFMSSINSWKISDNLASSMVPPLLSSTQVLPGPNNSRLTSVVLVIVLLCVVIVFTLLSILLIIYYRKRKISATKMEEDSKDQYLSNPNYTIPSVKGCSAQHRKSSKSKKKSIFFKSPIKKNTIEFHNKTSIQVPNQKMLDYENAEFSGKQFNDISSLNFSEVEKVELELANGHKESTMYHEVGPNTGCTPTVISDPSFSQPVSAQIGMKKTKLPSEKERNCHVLKEPANLSSACYYEEPIQTKFKLRGSSQTIRTFESTGYYVPTMEDRIKSGPVYKECLKFPDRYKNLNFFMEDDIYWEPATTTSELYSQLASKKYREIQRTQIRLQNSLGSGQFGEVYKATWSIHEHELELAVKTLKAGASEEDKVKFLQEAAIMGQFSHTNVIKMYGVVTVGEPIYICLEVLKNGDLREFLLKLNLVGSNFGDFTEVQQKFLTFARDIAAGMEYLSKKNFVHRDLAARNILLDKFQTCKVADFGMARNLMDDTYYTSSGGKIPIKWTAPEALHYRKYSTDSDVWSYGIVLFEIWSVGKKPFSNYTNCQVLRLLEKGFCQAPPPGCPRAIYKVMVDCWNPDHQSRPNFSTISQKYLKQPSSKLLYWASEDDFLSPAVGSCGSPLEEAENLHLDLQKIYTRQ